jgi:hypothetical protein
MIRRKTEKVRYKLPSGRGVKEVTYRIEQKGMLKGLRTPISVRYIKQKKKKPRRKSKW